MLKNYKTSASKYFDAANTQGVVRKRKKAFTLVELVIVIAVIGVLATVLISSFATVQNRATQTAALEAMKSSYDAINAEDILDGDMDYANGVLLYKSKKSDKLYTVIVTNGVLGDVQVFTDTRKNQSTANDFFALTAEALDAKDNTANKFDARLDTVNEVTKTLVLYLDQNADNYSGETGTKATHIVNSTGCGADYDGIVINQAAHIVSANDPGFAQIDTNGRGGAMYDMAHTEDAAVKFISTGAEAPKNIVVSAAGAGDVYVSSTTKYKGEFARHDKQELTSDEEGDKATD